MSQLVHKGTKIYLEGRLQTRQWEGQDGNQRNRTENCYGRFHRFYAERRGPDRC